MSERNIHDFEDRTKVQLMEKLKKILEAKIVGSVPPELWAFLWLSDIPKLVIFVEKVKILDFRRRVMLLTPVSLMCSVQTF